MSTMEGMPIFSVAAQSQRRISPPVTKYSMKHTLFPVQAVFSGEQTGYLH
jgi:hypothetical protein